MKKRIGTILLVIAMSLTGCAATDGKDDLPSAETTAANAAAETEPTTILTNTVPAEPDPELPEDLDLALYDAMLEAIRTYHTDFTVQFAASAEQINHIYDKIIREHPEFFWINGTAYTMYPDKTEFHFNMHPETAAEIQTICTQVEEAAERFLADIPADWSDYEKALYVHDRLAESIVYDEAGEQINQQMNEEQRSNATASYNTVYGGLVEHSAVCTGYAASYQYLLQRLGIECGRTNGTAGDSLHAWNYVLLDGDWYWVDVTWDDPTPLTQNDLTAPYHHAYCFVTNAIISRTHSFDPTQAAELPVCEATALNYYVQNDAYFDSFSPDAITDLIRRKSDNTYVEMMFEDEVSYQKAMTFFGSPNTLNELSDLFGEHFMFYYSGNDAMYQITVTLPPKTTPTAE